jgi:hypothetical protein
MAVTAVLHPDAQRFPVGATVKAYKRANFPGIWDFTGAPAGSQDASATVASDGSVTFTGLTENTDYVIYAASPDRYAQFATRTTRTLPDGSTAATQAAGDNSTKVATTAYVDSAASGTAVAKTLLDAKGDLIVATADDTPARLAVGTDGQVLKADSSASTGLAWGQGSFLGGIMPIGEYLAPPSAAATGAAGRVNFAHFTPFIVCKRMSFDRIGINVTTAQAGSQARLGVYSDSEGRPGTVLLDAGNVATTATGIIEVTGLSLTLNPGLYWGCVQLETPGSAQNVAATSGLGHILGAATAAGVQRAGYSGAHTGALVNTPTITVTETTSPFACLRRSA